MTANSQLISVKLVQGAIKKGVRPLVNANRLPSLSLPVLDGNLIKRLFDIFFSLFILIFFSPIYLLLMALIAVSSPGPIFYIQQRVGRNYRAVSLY